jgi:hypothetical protein
MGVPPMAAWKRVVVGAAAGPSSARVFTGE